MSRQCNENTQIALILKTLRANKTMTEQANDLQIHLTLLSHIANGRKPISKDLLKRIQDFYSLTDDEIVKIKYAGITEKQIREAKNIIDSDYTPEQLAIYLHFER